VLPGKAILYSAATTSGGGTFMPSFAHVGEFCSNEACPDYGKLQREQSKKNIKKAGMGQARPPALPVQDLWKNLYRN